MLAPSLGVSSLTWAAPRGGLFFGSDTTGAWFTMEGGLACTESADDPRLLFPRQHISIVRRCFSGRALCADRPAPDPAGAGEPDPQCGRGDGGEPSADGGEPSAGDPP